MAEGKVVITLKAGREFSDPWVVFHGDSVDEAGQLLGEFRQRGLFGNVKAAAQEFAQAPTTAAQAVANVQAAIPGSQVVPQAASAPALPATYPPHQQASLGPACGVCGGPTEEKSGTGRRGPWKGHFCINSKNLPQNDRHPVQWA